MTYEFGYKLTSKRIERFSVIMRVATVAEAKFVIEGFSWYVENFKQSLENQLLYADQMSTETPSETFYV